MDPNAEDSPQVVELAEAEVDFGTRENPVTPLPPRAPLASSIFRTARSPVWDQLINEDTTISGQSSTQDSEEIGRQQEAEFQRRLRGEYEQAQRRVGEVVNGSMERPMRLSSIRLSPAPPTTRTAFLSSLLEPFLSSSQIPGISRSELPPPTTLHEVLYTTKTLAGHLDRFGIFDIERSQIRLEPLRGGDDDEVELVLGLKEKGRVFLKAATDVGGGEGGGNVTARLRNALGGAETVELNASIGTKTKSAYQASFTTPLLASPLLSFAMTAYSQDRDHSAFASHRERSRGARAKFSAITDGGVHDLTYDYVQRDIGHLTPQASVSIRELAESSTKSSISHSWTSDTRDDPWLGTSGRLLKLQNEYAGLPGSSARSHFFKSTSHTQLSRALYSGSSINYSITSLTTLLLPFFTGKTYLPDRTYLGGPNSMRGWKVGGVGLRDGPDSLGGDLSWALGLSFFAPIPKKPNWPLRIHSFLNVGKVVEYNQGQNLIGNLTHAVSNPNVSIGLGVMYRFDPIRVEVNFAMPIVGRSGERTARGLGVGLGIEFL